MTFPDDDWSPPPELLAAYFDGELLGRPEHDVLRRRIVEWLHSHPEARAILDDYRRLAQLWGETAPADLGPDVWRDVEAEIAGACRGVRRASRRSSRRAIIAVLATAAAIALVVVLAAWRRTPQEPVQAKQDRSVPAVMDADEEFPVATAAEVVILRVEGADTQTLVVGELPLGGPLELAGPGDIALTSVQPDARDQMLPHLRIAGPRPPLIWARIEPESMEP